MCHKSENDKQIILFFVFLYNEIRQHFKKRKIKEKLKQIKREEKRFIQKHHYDDKMILRRFFLSHKLVL